MYSECRPSADTNECLDTLMRRRGHSCSMEYQVILERDAATRHYTATVPGLPVVVDAMTKREALKLAKEAIALYAEEANLKSAPAIHAELVTVNV